MSTASITAAGLAAHTPGTRNRYIDFLRVFALGVVVVGHTLMAAVVVRDGELEVGFGGELWVQLATWVFQVMPIFFIVGGYANAASWRSAQRRGIGYGGWVRGRARRLVVPTLVFIGFSAALTAAVAAAGVAPDLIADATAPMVTPVWFLAVYLVVVAAAPAMLYLHERFKVALPLGLAGLVVLFDILGRGFDFEVFAWLNFVPAWLAVHQLGFFWRDDALQVWRRHSLAITGAVVAVMVALTFAGPYPVAMVGVQAAEGSNNTPPTVLMVLLGAAQLGVVLRLEAAAQRWLGRLRVWTAVVAAAGAAMTVYLWHMTVLILTTGALWVTSSPLLEIEPMSPLWLATRPLFLGLVGVALVPVVAVLRRFDRPTAGDTGGLNTPRALLGALAAAAGLAHIAFGGIHAAGAPFEVSVTGLALLGAGAALLRLASHGARRHTAPRERRRGLPSACSGSIDRR